MMATVIKLYELGGPENFKVEDIDLGDPGPGEVLLRNHAVGLNFYDVYERTGVYPTELPAILGMESAGTVEQLGPRCSSSSRWRSCGAWIGWKVLCIAHACAGGSAPATAPTA